MLYLNHRESDITVLGPGHRYVIWLQGCRRRCKGCVFPEGQLLGKNGYWITSGQLLQEIQTAKQPLTGITISGGEPFLQPAGMAELIGLLRKSTKLDIMVYTGYTLQELQQQDNANVNYILNNIDLLIDGEYIEELNNNKIYRGSDNQHIWFLSDKYLPFKEKMENTCNRSLEFVFRNGEVFTVGLPAKNFQRDFWQAMEKRQQEIKV